MRYSQFLREQSAFWYVLTKDGLARSMNEDDFQIIRQMEDEGWEVVWDSARSEQAGLDYARQFYEALPWDHYRPIRMTEPKVLYRSITPAALADLAKTKTVNGKGNKFSGDHRPWVFFGDEINDSLIHQGNDIDRQASIALEKHPIQGKFKRLNASLRAKREEIVDALRRHMEDINWKRLRRNMPEETLDEKILSNFINDISGADYINQMIPYDPKNFARKIWNQYRTLRDKIQPLRDEFRKLHGSQYQTMRASSQALPFTSVIIQTKPVSGGLEYSTKAGSMVGFGEGEWGFPSGQLTLADIDMIYYVKDKEIIHQGGPETIKPMLTKIKAAQQTPVPQAAE